MAETIKAKTLKDILTDPNMSLEERRQIYGVKGNYTVDGRPIERHIEKVTIDGNEFTDYKAFSFLREKAYVKEPIRSGAGVIGNLNSYATFLTPRLKIDFSMLSIDSYRLLMTLIYGRNEFIVTCYDIVENKDVTYKMYFHPTEMPKLWTIARLLNGEESIELLAVEDFSVELVGTNADLDLYSTMYYYDTNKSSVEYGEDAYIGQEIVIGNEIDFINNPPTGYKFSHWVTENGTKIDNGISWRVNSNIILFAVWQPTTK